MKFERNGILYLNKQQQTFEIIHATIQFDGSQTTDARLKTDCKNADKSKLFCLFNNKHNILKYITSLLIDGFTHIGIKGKSFLNIFPNLLTLRIKNTARLAPKQMQIYFVRSNDLRYVIINVTEKHVKLYCALPGEQTCLSNPKGLKQFHVLLKLRSMETSGNFHQKYPVWKFFVNIFTGTILFINT